MNTSVLRVRNLSVALDIGDRRLPVVDRLNFDVRRDTVLGIVGESGSGKSVCCNALVQLLPRNAVVGGSALLDGRELLTLSKSELEDVRGRDIGFVFQDPMTSLSPSMIVGRQISETIIRHTGMSARDAWARAVQLLDMVGIPDAARRAGDYPHEFSGGMRQRVLIAMAVSCNPRLLIADEPTTALDVTIQAQILDLFRTMKEEIGLSVVFVTHDLGVVADICDEVIVMYGGEIVETGFVDQIFERPAHPYTRALLAAVKREPNKPLTVIPGAPPQIGAWPAGCRFAPRCGLAYDECAQHPALHQHDSRQVRCHLMKKELAIV
ncbi:Oligopeptide transport ATP-binding protein OppD [Hyphomicrobiales bacterium]|nr:Oligopeptide transport ATP-binding protein OppD [Hyphomicrobiales bacterium]CAH1691964.1 Oligopeptide transport ATP-binding protein OppD [Hyphomicrobiales bacterium]